MIFKRRPRFYGFYLDICRCIKEAEDMYGSGHGPEKLEYVVSEVCMKHDLSAKPWRQFVAAAVEYILSLPSKKDK